mmetsp:Transcript_13762/g.38824  ORF Transcript_13762/g.38824 Transcript_13762/m.38824 type:complete len:204 (+) Transcript_13762:225-836(+)
MGFPGSRAAGRAGDATYLVDRRVLLEVLLAELVHAPSILVHDEYPSKDEAVSLRSIAADLLLELVSLVHHTHVEELPDGRPLEVEQLVHLLLVVLDVQPAWPELALLEGLEACHLQPEGNHLHPLLLGLLLHVVPQLDGIPAAQRASEATHDPQEHRLFLTEDRPKLDVLPLGVENSERSKRSPQVLRGLLLLLLLEQTEHHS